MRPSMFGRPLPLHRLLETLDADSLRNVLRLVCERHPELAAEVVAEAPRPTVETALSVLSNYETSLRNAYPFGGNAGSDYTYNRVRQALTELLNSLSEFTPHFLPPQEQQHVTSLTFLDAATNFIHRLPSWDNPMHNHHKQLAYEEISKAWVSVVAEAAKKGAGMQLEYGGWDAKLAQHNQKSNGKMQNAVDELNVALGLTTQPRTETGLSPSDAIRSQLSRDYSGNSLVRVGTW
jgi:protein Cut8